MAKNELQTDIEKRELFYKMKRWQLGSIVLPLLCLAMTLLFFLFQGFDKQFLILLALAIILFIRFRVKAKKIERELNDKGGLKVEEIGEYTAAFNKVWTKQIIIWIVVAIVGLFLIWGSRNASSKKSKYDDVFDKDPNEWTEDEKEHVDGFFEWLKNQDD